MRTLSFNSGQGSSLHVKLTTLLLWAVAAAVITFWCLRWSASSAAQLPVPAPVAVVQVNAQSIAKALGAVAAPVAAPAAVASRYALFGVVAGHDSGGGAAVIAVSGKPAKPFRVGDVVEDGVVLQSLTTREARLGASVSGPTSAVLELPKPSIATFGAAPAQ